MAASVKGSDANPRAGDGCKFELKKYHWTLFNCYVCMKDSYDKERYRCDHCDRSRHKGCIQLPKEITLGPGPDGILGKSRAGKYCIVCGMPIHHIGYHCGENSQKSDMNVHPRCADLARSGHEPDLVMSSLVRSGRKAKPNLNYKLMLNKSPSCVRCQRTRPEGASQDNQNGNFCWSYSFIQQSKEYRIHVYCLSEFVIHTLKTLVPSGSRQQPFPDIILRSQKKKGIGIELDKLAEEFLKITAEQLIGIPIFTFL